jgi:hypothetical protein
MYVAIDFGDSMYEKLINQIIPPKRVAKAVADEPALTDIHNIAKKKSLVQMNRRSKKYPIKKPTKTGRRQKSLKPSPFQA